MSLLALFGTAGGSALGGLAYDCIGDYRGAFALIGAVALVGVVLILAAKPPKPRREITRVQ